MKEAPRDIRYPEKADSLAELERIVADCPPWAVRKFAVIYRGEQLDYGAACHRVQAERRKDTRR